LQKVALREAELREAALREAASREVTIREATTTPSRNETVQRKPAREAMPKQMATQGREVPLPLREGAMWHDASAAADETDACSLTSSLTCGSRSAHSLLNGESSPVKASPALMKSPRAEMVKPRGRSIAQRSAGHVPSNPMGRSLSPAFRLLQPPPPPPPKNGDAGSSHGYVTAPLLRRDQPHRFGSPMRPVGVAAGESDASSWRSGGSAAFSNREDRSADMAQRRRSGSPYEATLVEKFYLMWKRRQSCRRVGRPLQS